MSNVLKFSLKSICHPTSLHIWRVCSSFAHPPIMKIDTPKFRNMLTPELLTLIGIFQKHNFEIRIAGGAVRDILLGKEPKDIDFATTATPEQMKEMFTNEKIRMINMKGEKHGTITAHLNRVNFEITTLRLDVVSDGRHAEVEFTTDWKLDAGRRDLTVNSMFLGIDGSVYDYFGGYEDLKKRKCTFVGDPSKRLKEDYLRILRYFRFYGQIVETPDDHDEETLKAISENISGLQKITGERIWMELSKILKGNYVSSLISQLTSLGAGEYIGFPKDLNLKELKNIWEQGKHLDLQPITVLAAIMNNVDDMMAFHARCKLSNYERNLGLFIIEHRNVEQTSSPIKTYQILTFKTDGKPMDIRSYIIELLKYKCDFNLFHQYKSWDPPKFPLNGHKLRELNVPPGKPLGQVMKACKDYWIQNDFLPSEEELVSKIPLFLNDLGIKTKV